MADQIKIQQGALPWQPTDDAEIAETFLHYDFPRTGVMLQEGNSFLFACVDEYPKLSLWAYVLIDVDDADTIRESPSAAVAHFSTSERPITLALADDRGIFHTSVFVRNVGGPFLMSAIDSMLASLEALQEQRHLLSAAG